MQLKFDQGALEAIADKAMERDTGARAPVSYTHLDDCKVPVGDRDVVEVGDLANIDFVGTMDGEEFEGGSGAGYDLLIGSGSFVPGSQ